MVQHKALKRRLKWLGVTALMLTSGLISQGCSLGHEDYEGTWVVTELIPGEITVMDSARAGSQPGDSLSYFADQAQLGQRHCPSPSYQISYLPSNEFKERYRITSQTLFANQDEVKQVRVSCTEAGSSFGETLLLQTNGSAYTVSDGVFYKLEKAESLAG